MVKEFSYEVKLDEKHAQVLLEVDFVTNTIGRAKQIIEELGVHIFKIEKLSPQCVLLKLDIDDMREVVLKLTENGFLKISGYNASLSKI